MSRAKTLIRLLRRLTRPRILVVGDLMLDSYEFGCLEPASPEAIPLLRVDSRMVRLGGAAGVASLLSALEAEVALAGVVGCDVHGRSLLRRARRRGLSCDGVLTAGDRPTTLKRRLVAIEPGALPRPILRVDREVRRDLAPDLEAGLLRAIDASAAACAAIVVSDYGKGVCSQRILDHVFRRAAGLGLPVVVDPARGVGYERYRGATCVTPNRTEAGLAAGFPIGSVQDAGIAALLLRDSLCSDAIAITLDQDGILLGHRDGRIELFPAMTRAVRDVTGAGDTVTSILALCLADGVDYERALAMCNLAGGMQVERLGVSSITRAAILQELRCGVGLTC